MRRIQPYLFIIVSILFISACGPRYHITKDYLPPGTSSGMQCLNDCSIRNDTCVQSCNHTQAQCTQNAQLVAEDNFVISLDAYNEATAEYSSEIEIYYVNHRAWEKDRQRLKNEIDITSLKCEHDSHPNSAWCDIATQRQHEYQHLLEPEKPAKPTRPTLESNTAKLKQACKNECGCQDIYDKCYLGCGGQISNRRICVAGCD